MCGYGDCQAAQLGNRETVGTAQAAGCRLGNGDERGTDLGK